MNTRTVKRIHIVGFWVTISFLNNISRYLVVHFWSSNLELKLNTRRMWRREKKRVGKFRFAKKIVQLHVYSSNSVHLNPRNSTEKLKWNIATRVEVPEVISAEQRCFIVLTFFSADSENMINISADQLCFRADQL